MESERRDEHKVQVQTAGLEHVTKELNALSDPENQSVGKNKKESLLVPPQMNLKHGTDALLEKQKTRDELAKKETKKEAAGEQETLIGQPIAIQTKAPRLKLILIKKHLDGLTTTAEHNFLTYDRLSRWRSSESKKAIAKFATALSDFNQNLDGEIQDIFNSEFIQGQSISDVIVLQQKVKNLQVQHDAFLQQLKVIRDNLENSVSKKYLDESYVYKFLNEFIERHEEVQTALGDLNSEIKGQIQTFDVQLKRFPSEILEKEGLQKKLEQKEDELARSKKLIDEKDEQLRQKDLQLKAKSKLLEEKQICIQEVNQQLEELNRRLDEVIKRNGMQLAEHVSAIEILQSKNASQKQQFEKEMSILIAGHNSRLEELRQENATDKRQREEEIEKLKQDHQAKVDNLTKQFDNQKAEFIAQKDELIKKRDKVMDEVNQKIDQLNSTIKSQQQTLDTLRQKKGKRKKLLLEINQKLQEENTKLKNESFLNQQVLSKLQTLSEQQQNFENTKEDNEKLREKNKTLRRDNVSLKQDVETLATENEKFKKEVPELREKVKNYDTYFSKIANALRNIFGFFGINIKISKKVRPEDLVGVLEEAVETRPVVVSSKTLGESRDSGKKEKKQSSTVVDIAPGPLKPVSMEKPTSSVTAEVATGETDATTQQTEQKGGVLSLLWRKASQKNIKPTTPVVATPNNVPAKG